MLEKIETKEIMTMWEATNKNRAKYFTMIITEIVDRGDNDLGYVIYTADTQKERAKIPRDEIRGKRAALSFGVAAEPYPLIGNVVYHE